MVKLVQCEMCNNWFEMDNWKESDLLICKTCAGIMSFIRKQEIKQGHPFNNRLLIFDILRNSIK